MHFLHSKCGSKILVEDCLKIKEEILVTRSIDIFDAMPQKVGVDYNSVPNNSVALTEWFGGLPNNSVIYRIIRWNCLCVLKIGKKFIRFSNVIDVPHSIKRISSSHMKWAHAQLARHLGYAPIALNTRQTRELRTGVSKKDGKGYDPNSFAS